MVFLPYYDVNSWRWETAWFPLPPCSLSTALGTLQGFNNYLMEGWARGRGTGENNSQVSKEGGQRTIWMVKEEFSDLQAHRSSCIDSGNCGRLRQTGPRGSRHEWGEVPSEEEQFCTATTYSAQLGAEGGYRGGPGVWALKVATWRTEHWLRCK